MARQLLPGSRERFTPTISPTEYETSGLASPFPWMHSSSGRCTSFSHTPACSGLLAFCMAPEQDETGSDVGFATGSASHASASPALPTASASATAVATAAANEAAAGTFWTHCPPFTNPSPIQYSPVSSAVSSLISTHAPSESSVSTASFASSPRHCGSTSSDLRSRHQNTLYLDTLNPYYRHSMPDLNASSASHAPALQSPSSGNSSDGASSPHTPPATTASSVKQEYGPHNGRDDNQQIQFPHQESSKTLRCNGEEVKPTITANIDRNIFFREKRWTCYRRNYLFVQCSYSLSPCIPGAPLHVETGDGKKAVQALGVKLAAVMDVDKGKDVGLVQQTPKRDRGPQYPVEVQRLAPTQQSEAPVINSNASSTNNPYLPLQSDDSSKSPSSPPNGIHTFERIQFKQATANNGRRRAQQQYYYLLVELHADIRKSADKDVEWVKIAHLRSEPMVVRGRSPGHYKDSPASSASQGGAGGGFGPSGYGFSIPGSSVPYNISSSTESRNSMSGPSGGGGPAYYSSHTLPSTAGWATANSMIMRSPVPTLEPKPEAALTDQDLHDFETSFGYRYFANAASGAEPQSIRSSYRHSEPISSMENASFGSDSSQWFNGRFSSFEGTHTVCPESVRAMH